MQSLKLPGYRSTLKISPLRHAVALRDSIKLHGALHTVAGVGHDTERSNRRRPFIVLIPRNPSQDNFASERWEAQWTAPETWALSDTDKPVELFGAIRRVQIGPFHELEIPVPAPGLYRVQIKSQTPLMIKQTGGGWKDRLGNCDLLGAINQSVRRWFGEPIWLENAIFEGKHLTKKAIPVDTRWSGGQVAGWMLRAEYQVNAGGLLALRVIEHLGLGATVSRGYGRIICS